MTRILTTSVVALSLCLSTLVAADAGQPQGTWKLRHNELSPAPHRRFRQGW
jgi:hypothetical protein